MLSPHVESEMLKYCENAVQSILLGFVVVLQLYLYYLCLFAIPC